MAHAEKEQPHPKKQRSALRGHGADARLQHHIREQVVAHEAHIVHERRGAQRIGDGASGLGTQGNRHQAQHQEHACKKKACPGWRTQRKSSLTQRNNDPR